ncbi:MAG: ATP-binding protein [Methanosarcinales archaeon]|nr:ATP-binding protein [Methanosarcinales archaeon]
MTVNVFARKIAHIITSKYNQNYTAIFTGGTGTGKSYAAISLAISISEEVARIKGGRPSDYFSLEDCVSVIDIMQFFRVLDNAKKYNVVILDDAGISINARRFMDTINVTLNSISQTYRTLNLCTILTVPEMFFIDRVMRSLVDALYEMQGMIAPDLSYGKLFEIQRKSRVGSSGKLYYVYPRGHQKKMIGVTFEKPPDDICARYETLRSSGALEYKRAAIDQIISGEKRIAAKNEEKTHPWSDSRYVKAKERVANGESITQACVHEKYPRSSFSVTRTKEEFHLSSLST